MLWDDDDFDEMDESDEVIRKVHPAKRTGRRDARRDLDDYLEEKRFKQLLRQNPWDEDWEELQK